MNAATTAILLDTLGMAAETRDQAEAASILAAVVQAVNGYAAQGEDVTRVAAILRADLEARGWGNMAAHLTV